MVEIEIQGLMASITQNFEIPSTPTEAYRGRKWDIGTFGKHETKSLKFLLHQHLLASAKFRTPGPMATTELNFLNSWDNYRGQ